MITYVLTVSKYFQKSHPRAGEHTWFPEKIYQATIQGSEEFYSEEYKAQFGLTPPIEKRHTIRTNYEWWKKRVDAVNARKAVLSVRTWTSAPYNSKQEFIVDLFGEEDETEPIIILQKLVFDRHLGIFIDDIDNDVTVETLATNDGLSIEDFKAWFKDLKYDEPYAIIHFGTEFKY